MQWESNPGELAPQTNAHSITWWPLGHNHERSNGHFPESSDPQDPQHFPGLEEAVGRGSTPVRLHLPGREGPVRARPHQPGAGPDRILHRAAEHRQEHVQVSRHREQ